MRALGAAIASAVVLVASAGCGGASDQVRILHMASADPAGIAHDPAVEFFTTGVARLSGGKLRIVIDERWGRDGTAHEDVLLRDVARGAADLGWAHTRSFARVGVASFDALDAPMLIDRDGVQDEVIHSRLAARMLAGTRAAGLQGLALLAGPLSRLVGPSGPLRDAAHVRQLAFGVRRSRVADLAVRALRAYPRPITYDNVGSLYIDGQRQPGRPAALEDDLGSVFFDRYGGMCSGPIARCGTLGPWVTANVLLWPRTAVLVADPRRLSGLTARQRAWLTEAAAQATTYSTTLSHDDQRLVPELCAAGVRFTTAPPAALASLRRAWRPVYARLEEQPAVREAIREIERLRGRAPAAAPLRIPQDCRRQAHPIVSARGVRSTLPNGIYRVWVSQADLRAAGARASGDRPGIVTLTLRDGRWRLVFTEPGRHVQHGTYAGTPRRTTWASAGPAGRDEAYLSIVVDRDRGLRFHVARAGNLPFAQATYASHRWRRIGD